VACEVLNRSLETQILLGCHRLFWVLPRLQVMDASSTMPLSGCLDMKEQHATVFKKLTCHGRQNSGHQHTLAICLKEPSDLHRQHAHALPQKTNSVPALGQLSTVSAVLHLTGRLQLHLRLGSLAAHPERSVGCAIGGSHRASPGQLTFFSVPAPSAAGSIFASALAASLHVLSSM